MGDTDGFGGDAHGEGGRIDLARIPPVRLGEITIEPGLRRVVHDQGREEFLEPRVMQVLVALIRADGQILSRDDLLASCWGGVVVGEDAITRVIGRLRRIADGVGVGAFKVQTIAKVGYRLLPAAALREPPPATAITSYARAPGETAPLGERRYIYGLLTDLGGFSALARSLPPETVADVLNTYLSRLSRIVLEHGGTVDKVVGDTVVAFWGAPIARVDDGEQAVRAAIAAWRTGETFRLAPLSGHPPLGVTRVGLHRGDAIVGAFGGEGRLAYSALGDAMNTASALESANIPLRTRVLASREAIPHAMAAEFRAMGRIGLRGRSNPVEVFEAAPDFPAEARDRLNAAYARFDAGDDTALGEISTLAAEYPEDIALHALHERLATIGPGGVFRLG